MLNVVMEVCNIILGVVDSDYPKFNPCITGWHGNITTKKLISFFDKDCRKRYKQ